VRARRALPTHRGESTSEHRRRAVSDHGDPSGGHRLYFPHPPRPALHHGTGGHRDDARPVGGRASGVSRKRDRHYAVRTAWRSRRPRTDEGSRRLKTTPDPLNLPRGARSQRAAPALRRRPMVEGDLPGKLAVRHQHQPDSFGNGAVRAHNGRARKILRVPRAARLTRTARSRFVTRNGMGLVRVPADSTSHAGPRGSGF
jgi:hypothetical protein